jgi:DNA-binding GntR family transcriptional regulator
MKPTGATTIPPLRRRALLSDDVYEALKEYLIDGHIAPGARVVIENIALQLGVSPTPVREALVRLESDGLVGKEAMRGYFLTPTLDLPGFMDLYDMRLLLEPHAAFLAAQRTSLADLKVLRASLRDISKASAGSRYREFARLLSVDSMFHETIAGISANPLLADAVQRLRSHLRLSRLYVNHGAPGWDHTLQEHQVIVAALESHDAEAASAAMTAHIERSRNSLMALFTNTDEPVHELVASHARKPTSSRQREPSPSSNARRVKANHHSLPTPRKPDSEQQ